MKFRNIFWGIILILLGVLFTLDNMNMIDFAWYNLWRLWPVVLVLWGISILPVRDFIKVILVLLVLGGSVTYMLNDNVSWYDKDFEVTYFDDDDEYDYQKVDQFFTIPFEDTAAFASLEMEVAASKFTLMGEAYELVDFEKKGSTIDYKYSVKHLDDNIDIDIYIEDDVVIRGKSKNKVDMSLNPFPIWDLSYDVGAADVNMDLTSLKVANLDIEGGAAAFKVKLGNNVPESRVKFETGASSITVKVPEEAGCDLNISAVLSGKTISGFEKIDHGHYQTSNFNEAENKIYIDIETAVSSYSIIRY
jgi:hypothetical protein